MRKVPVAYLVFDVLYAGNELLLERPLRERAQVLDALLAAARNPIAARNGSAQARLIFDSTEPAQNARVLRAPVFQASSAPELDSLFDAAQSRGNEGLMIKDRSEERRVGKECVV